MYITSKLPPEVTELIHKYGHLYEQALFRGRSIYLFVMFLVFLNILLHPLPVLRRVKNAYTYKMKELEHEEQDLFFVSAYYYGKEYSLYENQLSLVFVAPRDAQWERRKIVVIRSNETNAVLESMKVHRASPHNICKFVTLVGKVVLKDELVNLEILVNRNVANIHYLPADNVRRDLVVCTPLIYKSVRWQNVLLATHVFSQFGGHLQSYVSSATPPFFELLIELKRLKGVSVDALPDFYGSSNLEEIEFGGVTVANCDCLNKYRSSARFITFLEWDELLIPKTHTSTFGV
ncbi:unnamed protein product [Caenorhabditis sp. 36 PRJEB53466]|nr:unnamed protein product [Caenorhabditis sp. 36 PRJEB53466]